MCVPTLASASSTLLTNEGGARKLNNQQTVKDLEIKRHVVNREIMKEGIRIIEQFKVRETSV